MEIKIICLMMILLFGCVTSDTLTENYKIPSKCYEVEYVSPSFGSQIVCVFEVDDLKCISMTHGRAGGLSCIKR